MSKQTLSLVALGAISNGALQSKNLPSRIKVLDWGKNTTLDEPVFLDERSVKVFDINQKRSGGLRVALDFDHCTVPDSVEYVKGQPKSIAAYGTPHIIPGDGLWLENLEYTPLGEENARNYSDLSPAPIIDNEGVVIGLHSVALTPKGAVEGLTFFSANDIQSIMKKSTMKLSTDDKEVVEHLDKDIEEQEKDKELKGKLKSETAPNDYKDQQPVAKSVEEEQEEHPPHCMCGTCTADLKQQIFTKLSLVADPFGEIRKTMSAVVQPNAYITEPSNNKTFRTFMDKKITKMASELGLPDSAELEKRLKAWLAEWLGDKTVPAPITGDPKPAQFSADTTKLEERIKVLESDRAEQIARFSAMEKDTIVFEATKNGKVVPFSAEEIKELKTSTLKSIIDKLPATVPMVAKTKVLSAEGKTETKKTMTDSARAIQEQVESVLANS